MVEVLTPEDTLKLKISQKEWLRTAVAEKKCHSQEELSMRVMHMTEIGNDIALMERQLYELRMKEQEDEEKRRQVINTMKREPGNM